MSLNSDILVSRAAGLRRAFAAAFAVLGLVLGAPAFAEAVPPLTGTMGDLGVAGAEFESEHALAAYRLSEASWNGLSSFGVLLDHFGVTVTESSTLDLRTADLDVLVLVHPTAEVNAGAVTAWVRDGGSLWVADDFGAAPGLLSAFGLQRVPTQAHMENLNANPALPMLGRVGTHDLSRDVHRLVLNHASALQGPGLPVFAFQGGAGAVYDMSLGSGAAVFVSDASVLTNLMLPIRGNARFAANVLERLCPADGCRVVLMTGDVRIDGPDARAPSEDEGRVPALMERLREAIERLRDSDIHPRALRAASVLLLLGTLFFAGTVFPGRAPRRLLQRIGLRATAPLNEFEFNLQRFLGRRRQPSFAIPAALLKERFERVFYPAIGLKVPPADATTAFFASATKRYVARHEPDASPRRVRRIQATLAGLGKLSERKVMAVGRVPWLESKELLRWHQDVTTILETMGLNERFLSDIQRPA